MTSRAQRGRATRAISFTGSHFPPDVLLLGVRWQVASPLSYRHVEARLEARGVPLDHATIQRWVVQDSPELAAACHRRKRPVGVSWRMDETYSKGKGPGRSLQRAGDKHGQPIAFLLPEQRDTEAALRFRKQAMRRNGLPETIPSAGSAAHEAAIKRQNQEQGTTLAMRPVQYFNHIVEQDHRGVKRVTRPRLGFKAQGAAQDT